MRPTWDQYFADMTRLVATRSTCLRAQHGCIIVRDKHIISTGYNGSPPGTYHCDSVGVCFRQKHNIPPGQRYEKCRAVHAEQNALIQAAKFGISVLGASLYVTDIPCEICAKLIMTSGIKEVIIITDSRGYSSEALHDFTLAGNIVRFLNKE